jgi:hypothetical protein
MRVFETGSHTFTWNGTDGTGRELATGVYIVRLRSGNRTVARRVTLLR